MERRRESSQARRAAGGGAVQLSAEELLAQMGVLVDLRAAVMLVVVGKSWLRGSMMPCRGMAQCNLAQLVLRKWKGGL